MVNKNLIFITISHSMVVGNGISGVYFKIMVHKVLYINDRPNHLNPFIRLIFESLSKHNFEVSEINIKKSNYFRAFFQLSKRDFKVLFFTRTSVMPFVLLIIGVSKLTHTDIKFIYWPFELYGQQNSKSSYFVKKIESLCINHFDLLITQNNYRALYFKIIGRTRPILVVRNYKPLSKLSISASASEPTTTSSPRQLIYIGSLIRGRNLKDFISTVMKMEDTQLVIYAKKKASSHFLAEHHNLIHKAVVLGKLLIHDEVKEHIIPEILLQHKVGIISYENNCLNNFTASPTKITEYLNAGLICIVPDFPVFDDLIPGNSFQIVKYQDDTVDFRHIVESAFSKFSAENKFLAMQNSLNLDWSLEIKKFINSLKNLLA